MMFLGVGLRGPRDPASEFVASGPKDYGGFRASIDSFVNSSLK